MKEDLMKLKEMIFKFSILLNGKWLLNKPKKSEYLIFDKNCENVIKEFLKKKETTILTTRFEDFYLSFLLKIFLKFKFKNVYLEYQKSLIQYINPKLIITFTDNNVVFYKLKKYFPYIKFISVQNGNRFGLGDFLDSRRKFNNLKKLKLKSDFYIVQDEFSKKFLSQVFNSKFIVLGSLKNNLIKLKKQKKNKRILFISQWRDTERFLIQDQIYPKDKFYEAENILLKKVVNYCNLKNITLDIKLATAHRKEKNFFKKKLRHNIKSFNLIDYSETNYRKNYSFLDRYTLVTTVDSTLGFECMMRGIKTVFYSIRNFYLKIPNKNKPNELSNLVKIKHDLKSFYVNKPITSDKNFNQFLDVNYNLSYKKWYQKNFHIVNKFKYFDLRGKNINDILK